MHIQLHERCVADAPEAVDLTGLDDQDVAGAGCQRTDNVESRGHTPLMSAQRLVHQHR
jgi:hypothetical protein